MCTVSMVGDFYSDKWRENDWLKPYIQPQPNNQPLPNVDWQTTELFVNNPPAGISKEDFDALKKEVMDMKELLKRALEYDKKNDEPYCEMEDKVATLKKVAELFKVDLSEIFKEK